MLKLRDLSTNKEKLERQGTVKLKVNSRRVKMPSGKERKLIAKPYRNIKEPKRLTLGGLRKIKTSEMRSKN